MTQANKHPALAFFLANQNSSIFISIPDMSPFFNNFITMHEQNQALKCGGVWKIYKNNLNRREKIKRSSFIPFFREPIIAGMEIKAKAPWADKNRLSKYLFHIVTLMINILFWINVAPHMYSSMLCRSERRSQKKQSRSLADERSL